ncbi:hypothetical protein DN069_13680 [Streptacidiphilus pinicola]|uniref:Uncharacterized protein n=1 Tax=Streptacidiphilus pinicola TaxID=2219663 RepID=A0A2X0KCQ2_9ACTN|nr:hypothetical protein [Streptacidiphilus pinicola]RAG85009.1 hypothetical protein DN069_13680 [Streptacidiphilus pinicola]
MTNPTRSPLCVDVLRDDNLLPAGTVLRLDGTTDMIDVDRPDLFSLWLEENPYHATAVWLPGPRGAYVLRWGGAQIIPGITPEMHSLSGLAASIYALAMPEHAERRKQRGSGFNGPQMWRVSNGASLADIAAAHDRNYLPR